MTEENHEKTPARLVGTGIRTRDLPNASLVRYHGATSLGEINIINIFTELNVVCNWGYVSGACVRRILLYSKYIDFSLMLHKFDDLYC